MKIKTISRSIEASSRDSRTEVRKVHKNADPKLHPFEKARELTRAVTAAKLDRMFAHPFIGALAGHSDGVYCSAVNPKSLVSFVSGSADGEVLIWDLASQKRLWSVYAHTGFVRGLCFSHDGRHFFSCGDDKRIRQWQVASSDALAVALSAAAPVGAKRPRSAMAAAAGEEDAEDAEGVTEGEDGAAAGGASGRRGGVEEDLYGPAAAGGAGGRRYSNGAAAAAASSYASGGRPTFGTASVAGQAAAVAPVATWSSAAASGSSSSSGGHSFLYMDHHPREPLFATAGPGGIDVWHHSRSAPAHSYAWGADSVTTVRWNPAEAGLLASTGADRSIVLFDVRADSALRKVVLTMACNALAWNPREPFNFTVASEDANCYTFDMRRLDAALMVHKDHVAAVMDIAYSPTGVEFVTGSYDRTVRVWRADAGRSREVYHTKRMQRVHSVQFTGDAKYVLSGSDDANVRIWKAQAAAPLGRTLPRERAALDYHGALLKRFAHMPEVKRIAGARRPPKLIGKLKAARHGEEQRERRKLANVRAHTAPDSREGVPDAERTKRVVAEFK